ncbi:MAG: hypothetical protein ACR2GV_02730 [Gaiellaceae bacterium]
MPVLPDTYTIEQLESALLRAGRNAGPGMLFGWLSDQAITTDQLRALILDVWSGAEWPVLNGEEESMCLDWFDETGFVSDTGRPPPSEPITAWRGTSLASGGRGFSWTVDIDKARWFAQREIGFGRGPAGVYEAVVPPSWVLGKIEAGRGEAEVIVDPLLFDLTYEQRRRWDIPPPIRLVETITEVERAVGA